MLLKLALRNLIGGRTRTWLNALVLSFSFVAVIWGQSLFEGMDREMSKATIAQEFGGGQYWAEGYDPLDPLSIDDARRPLDPALTERISAGRAAPILIVLGTIYPQGRLQSILIKGVDPDQAVLELPFDLLRGADGEVPALIGRRTSEATGLRPGDAVTLRWRDAGGTFDARDVTIVEVFRTQVQTVDAGQIWVPLEWLRRMTGLEGQATLVTLAPGAAPLPAAPAGWRLQDQDALLADIKAFVRMKSVGFAIFYITLMAMALLAVFNTQVLSVWRRRKEIGTLMALGMTRGRVIALFTLEGGLLSLLAIAVGAIYGVPLLVYMSVHGWVLPADQADSFGLALDTALYPAYTTGLFILTVLLAFLATTVVSWLPARKIAQLKPTDALRGKLS